MSDITNQLLSGCSPYIHKIAYDITDRELMIELLEGPDSPRVARRIGFNDIKNYSETNLDDSHDDNCIDSVIGINWIDDNSLCIHTQKKEIILSTNKQPTMIKTV